MEGIKFLITLVCFMSILTGCFGLRTVVPEVQRTSSYWENAGQKQLNEALRLRNNENRAKNVIMFLGDGMGVTTVTSMRIYKGQKNNRSGEEELLAFDEFPYVSLSKTYGIDRMTSDSANTATAYLCGVKANYGTLGVNGYVEFENCSSEDPSKNVDSILQWAQEAGKWTGYVTTTRVTHASPAGLYAHSASRNWEGYSPDPKCKDIAHQLVKEKPGKDIRVIMGGGARNFVASSQTDPFGTTGVRTDERNLLKEWALDRKNRSSQSHVIHQVEELRSLNPSKVDYLLGIFHSDHLPYVADRPSLKDKYPSLAEMTETAIKVLRRNSEGFFLFVEGGSIDLAHHMNWGMKALEEGVEFDKAIQSAIRLTDESDTLIVVTADHSHTFTVGGNYPFRGTNILGLGGVSDVDNMTFTTLGYHNGPGYKSKSRERNLTENEAVSKDFKQDALFPMAYETHGAEDVAVYARGPMAHLFHGVHDQSYIPYVMAYASCVGVNQNLCSDAWSLLSSSPWTLLMKLSLIGVSAYLVDYKL